MKKTLLILLISAVVLVSVVDVVHCVGREEMPIPTPPIHGG